MVLEEILEWSSERPAWQRDALRRLVLSGELSADDLDALTGICKSTYGLAEQQEVVPLSNEHVPVSEALNAPVSLVSILHQRGANALAEDQTLRFGPHLTVVYGDNAAGKSGYIRILKSACRSRGQEQILGNVTSGASPHALAVSIKYNVGSEPQPREWAGTGEDKSISRVSVFDTQSAAVHLTEKTDVAFRPFGLDLFDKLVQACRAVRSRLENEQNAISTSALRVALAEVPEGTAAAKLLASVSSLTKPEAIKALTRLSPADDERLVELEKSLIDLQTNDPKKLAQQLNVRAGRVQSLARHLKNIETTLSDHAVSGLFNIRAEGKRIAEEAKRLREATFPADILAGTGSERWTALWEAARRFSFESAYPDQPFPVVANGAHCVLCQQELSLAAKQRLEQFEHFASSSTETDLRTLREVYPQLRRSFLDIGNSDAVDDVLEEIGIEDERLATVIREAISANERRRQAVLSASAGDEAIAADCPGLVSISHEAEKLAEKIQSRIRTLQDGSTDKVREPMLVEIRELRARKLLAKHEQAIFDEIERKQKFAAYGLSIEETRTHAITQKSTAVTKTAVSQKLKHSFKDELKRLGFRHVDVELREAGGTEGVLYHKLVLSRAPGVELPKVVSEGEQRCLSIAAFFAELSTADDPSGIVFDDPVSSLDYKFREAVARRLVEEANTRQVIVFTHDIVFLLFLKQFAEDVVEQLDQHIRQLSRGAGVCVEELPWVAMKVREKIGYLKNSCQKAEKLFREGHQEAYEKEATHLYGLLREGWERGLEEVLLGGVVERFRPGVQTQQIAVVADISGEDCQAVEAAITKCSRWLPGHDQAAAARAPVPEPTELRGDIEALENWVATIRKRRR